MKGITLIVLVIALYAIGSGPGSVLGKNTRSRSRSGSRLLQTTTAIPNIEDEVTRMSPEGELEGPNSEHKGTKMSQNKRNKTKEELEEEEIETIKETLYQRHLQKEKNLELCAKWGSLEEICKVIMSAEQTADYPVYCGIHACTLHVEYNADAEKDKERNKFSYKISGSGLGEIACDTENTNAHIEVDLDSNTTTTYRDQTLQNCGMHGSWGSFGGHVGITDEHLVHQYYHSDAAHMDKWSRMHGSWGDFGGHVGITDEHLVGEPQHYHEPHHDHNFGLKGHHQIHRRRRRLLQANDDGC